ncbi:MAG: hypothetical protein K1X67_14325 [Fimbriimonadaceae bacterium]|nr:hypothetical protein [Fimbriimonadaceae bacterium]
MTLNFKYSLQILLATVAMLGTAPTASAAWWKDGFDSYPEGPLVPQGGWESYLTGTYNITVTSGCARNGSNGILVDGGPVLKTLSGFTTGKYAFHASVMLANTGPFPQIADIRLLNQYLLGEDYSLQLRVAQSTVSWYESGSLQGSGGVPVGGGPGSLSFSPGWADILCIIDLDNDLAETFVNGQLLARHPWKSEAFSLKRIEAVMLDRGGGQPVCMDDFCLVPYRPRYYRRGIADNFSTTGVPDFAIRSAALNAAYPASPWKGFDDATGNKHVGVSWTGLPISCGVLKAEVITKMQASAGGSNNDVVYLGLPATGPTFGWGANLANLPAALGTWNVGDPARTFSFDLGNLPAGIGSPAGTSLMDRFTDPSYYGGFDMLVQDDSMVDYALLKLWLCCPTVGGFPVGEVGNASIAPRIGGGVDVNLTGPNQGIVVPVGEALTASVEVVDSPDFSLPGRSIRGTFRGRLNGTDQVVLGTVNSVGIGSGVIRYDYDFSNVTDGPVNIREISVNGQVLSSSTGAAAGSKPCPTPTCPRWAYNMHKDPITHQWVFTRFCLDAVHRGISFDFGPIESEDPDDKNYIQEFEVTATGVTSFDVDRPTGAWFGVKEKGVQFNGYGDQVTVHPFGGLTNVQDVNIGSGVRADATNTLSLQITVSAVGGENGPPAMSRLDTYLYGDLDGNANQYVGRLHQTFVTADRYNLASNFDPANAITVRVKQIRNGVHIGGGGVVAANLLGSITGSNSQTKLVHDIADGTIALVFDPPVEHNFESVTRVIDRLEIRPNAIGHTVSRYSQVDLEGLNLGEFTLAEVDATRLVSGTVTLSEFDPDEAGQAVTLQVFAPGDSVPLETHNVTLGAAGAFSLASGIVGPVDITVKGSHWLRKRTSTYISTAGLTGFTTSLINGDCDDDNEVGIADYAMVSASYNLCLGDGGYLPAADLNGDDCIDIADYAILSANYGLTGDE